MPRSQSGVEFGRFLTRVQIHLLPLAACRYQADSGWDGHCKGGVIVRGRFLFTEVRMADQVLR